MTLRLARILRDACGIGTTDGHRRRHEIVRIAARVSIIAQAFVTEEEGATPGTK